MFKKIIILFIFSFLLNQCGFSPLHSNKLNANISIKEMNFEGDKKINNFLKTNLNQFINNNNKNNFKIIVNTEYNKNVLSKDRAAKITNYEIICVTTFEIYKNDNLIKNLKVSEKKNIENISDKFEEQTYENVIKQNFASSMANKLITELSIINDN